MYFPTVSFCTHSSHLLRVDRLFPSPLTFAFLLPSGATDVKPDAAAGKGENTEKPEDQKTNEEEVEVAQNVEEHLSSSSMDAEEVLQDPEGSVNSYLVDFAKNVDDENSEVLRGDSEGGFLEGGLEDVLADGSAAASDNGLREANELDAGDHDSVGDPILEFIDSFLDPVELAPPEPAGGDEDQRFTARNYHDLVVANLTRNRTPVEEEVKVEVEVEVM